MFHLSVATNAAERISELGRFLEFWYGPRRAEFGEPEDRLAAAPVPDALRRFYALAGRWPSPKPYDDDDERFYEGQGGHHLLRLDRVEARDGGQVVFFVEYQGDWQGHVAAGEADPPVWISGRWDEPGPGEGTRRVSSTLSGFLVTHCLMTTVYEWANSPHPNGGSYTGLEALEAWFGRERAAAELLWEVEPGGCPQYDGALYLHRHVLVHVSGRGYHKFGANHPAGVALLREVTGEDV
jgi:hypothetical protein